MALSDGIIGAWKIDTTAPEINSAGGSNVLSGDGLTGLGTGIDGGGYAGSISDTAKYLRVTDNSIFGVRDGLPWTLNCWVKVGESPTIEHLSRIVGWESNLFSQIYAPYGWSGGLVNLEVTGTGFTYAEVSPNTWHMLTLTCNGTSLQVSIDAEETGAPMAQPTLGSALFNVGPHTGDGAGTEAEVDELSFWNRTLTSEEITSLYSAGTGLFYPFGSPPPDPSTGEATYGRRCRLLRP